MLGKGITGGYLPMSATVASGTVFLAFMGEDLGPRTFYHGHSYGGNALAAAVATRHLELLAEWDVLANVEARSEELRQLLAERISPLAQVADMRLCGLLGGVELKAHVSARAVCAEAVRRGVLLRPLGQVVPLVPPLTITSDELEQIVSVLEQALAAGSEMASVPSPVLCSEALRYPAFGDAGLNRHEAGTFGASFSATVSRPRGWVARWRAKREVPS